MLMEKGHFRNMMIITVLLLATQMVLGAVGDGTCQGQSAPNGATLDSSAGVGAVEICGDCYKCGESDGVCPEDFYNGTHYGNCSSYADPDCTATITGYVSDSTGRYLNDVDVTTQILHIDPNYHDSTGYNGLTGLNGFYSLDAPMANYRISFKKFGFETRLVKATDAKEIPPGSGNYQLNVTLENGSCHTDCTGFHYPGEVPRCNALCDGFKITDDSDDSCSFQTSYSIGAGEFAGMTFNIAEECDSVQLGYKKTLAVGENQILLVDCCEGIPYTENRQKASIQKEGVSDLIIRTLVAEMEGRAELVNVKILVFKK